MGFDLAIIGHVVGYEFLREIGTHIGENLPDTGARRWT